MQDNNTNNQHLNEAFLDESWEKMRSMLDNDLPVGAAVPPKRVGGVYRMAAVLLFLIAIGGGFWLLTNNSSTENVASIEKKEVNQPVAELKTPNQLTQTQETLIAKTKNQKLREVTNNTTITPLFTPMDLPSTSSTVSINIQNAPASKLSKFSKKKVENNNVISLPSKKVTSLLSSENVEESLIATVEGKMAEAILLLPSETHPELEKEKASIRDQFIFPNLGSKWKVGLIAGIQFEKLRNDFGGFNGGLLLNRAMGKYFSIETGLTFNLSQFNNTLINNTPTQLYFNQSEEDVLPGVSGSVTATPYNNNETSIVEASRLGSASWLSVPVLLTYQPARRIKVNMGVEFGRLLHAKDVTIFNEGVTTMSNMDEYLKRSNTAALFGIGWYPQDNLGFDLRYNFGFTDLSKSNPLYIDQTDTRSSLQCSLIYYFGPSS